MTTQLVLRFEDAGQFARVWDFLRENGLEKLVFTAPKRKNGSISQPMKPRIAGFSKAKFIMSPDFNEPLEDFKEYME